MNYFLKFFKIVIAPTTDSIFDSDIISTKPLSDNLFTESQTPVGITGPQSSHPMSGTLLIIAVSISKVEVSSV